MKGKKLIKVSLAIIALLALVVAFIAMPVGNAFAWDETSGDEDQGEPRTGDALLTATIVIACVAGAVIIVCVVLYVLQVVKEKKQAEEKEQHSISVEDAAIQEAILGLTQEDIEKYKQKLSDDFYGDDEGNPNERSVAEADGDTATDDDKKE